MWHLPAGPAAVNCHDAGVVLLHPSLHHHWNTVNELCIWQNCCGDAFRLFHYPSLCTSVLWETISESWPQTWHLTAKLEIFSTKGVKEHYWLPWYKYIIYYTPKQHRPETTFSIFNVFLKLLSFWLNRWVTMLKTQCCWIRLWGAGLRCGGFLFQAPVWTKHGRRPGTRKMCLRRQYSIYYNNV